MKTVTKGELEAARLSAIVHDVSMQTTLRDLQSLINPRTGMPIPNIKFGRPYGESFDDLK